MRDLRWAWDFVVPNERSAKHGAHAPDAGGSVLVETRDNAKDDEPGTTLFVASTASPDRAMDVVSQNWKLAAFRANPVILDNHDSLRVVGHATEAKVPKAGDDAGKLMIRVKWDMDSPDPTIRNVGHQHMSGIRRAGSVGFRAGKKTRRDKLPKEHEHYQEPIEIEGFWGREMYSGTLFEAPELLEFSSATVPMNAEALQRALVAAIRADGDPAAEDAPPADDAPPDEWAWLEDEEAVGRVADALFPVFMARAKSALFPEPEPEADAEAPADEPVADKMWRSLWVPRLRAFVRSDTDMRRILRAVLDTGPPAARSLTPRGDGLDFLFTERS